MSQPSRQSRGSQFHGGKLQQEQMDENFLACYARLQDLVLDPIKNATTGTWAPKRIPVRKGQVSPRKDKNW